MNPIPLAILNACDFVLTPSMQGRKVEKCSVSFSMDGPVHFGFHGPNLLFQLEDLIIVFSKLIL